MARMTQASRRSPKTKEIAVAASRMAIKRLANWRSRMDQAEIFLPAASSLGPWRTRRAAASAALNPRGPVANVSKTASDVRVWKGMGSVGIIDLYGNGKESVILLKDIPAAGRLSRASLWWVTRTLYS